MKSSRSARRNTAKITPVLTWLLTGLLALALAWLWWTSSQPARNSGPSTLNPIRSPVASTSSNQPAESASKPAAPRLESPRSLSLAVTQSVLLNNATTAAPPTLVLVVTSRPIPPVTGPMSTVSVSNATLPASNGPTVAFAPVVTSAVPSRLAPFAARGADPDAKFRMILGVQLALARQGISPGSLDGALGAQTRAAIRTFQERTGLSLSGEPDTNTVARLAVTEDSLTQHCVTSGEIARVHPLGTTWLAKSEQGRLDYESLLELVSERYAASPKLLQRLNPGVDWNRLGAGATLVVPAFVPPAAPGKAAFLKIFLSRRVLQAYDGSSNLLAHFPCSIAQRVEKRPAGETLRVSVVAPDPNYTFDPAVFPESAEARTIGRKLILHPGPNNPVGTAWIGLDKPGYGIHGTPKPEEVGRTESHGCFRLANWNAEQLLKMVSVGTPIIVEP